MKLTKQGVRNLNTHTLVEVQVLPTVVTVAEQRAEKRRKLKALRAARRQAKTQRDAAIAALVEAQKNGVDVHTLREVVEINEMKFKHAVQTCREQLRNMHLK